MTQLARQGVEPVGGTGDHRHPLRGLHPDRGDHLHTLRDHLAVGGLLLAGRCDLRDQVHGLVCAIHDLHEGLGI